MEIPATMRAAFIRSTGGADRIEVGTLPTPAPGPTDVLVRFEASAVNHVDLFVRSGAYRTPLPFPFVIGRDLVGTVARAGPGAVGFAEGDRVWTNSLGYGGRQGAWSDYAAVAAERLYRLPEGVRAETAAAALHPGATAYIGLFRRAAVAAGDTVLVGGAGGAVGSAAMQLAVGAGARVIATASARDREWCASWGAEAVLDYSDPELYGLIREAAPGGVDLWFDTSGHHDFRSAVPLLRKGASIVLMAGLADEVPLPVGALYTRDVSVHGFAISNASIDDLSAAAVAVNRLLEAGRLAVRAGATLRLDAAEEAHRLQEERAVRGRIVLVR
jgi:NADPH:quinone reductase-like Zn-dependent oxidoreductase